MNTIHQDRIRDLNNKPVNVNGDYVLYYMQASLRFTMNLALKFAVSIANDLNKPLIIVYRLDKNYPEANYRHFYFVSQALKELMLEAEGLGISFRLLTDTLKESITPWLRKAAAVVTDCNYLQLQRKWVKDLSEIAKVKVVQVEDNVLVPVEKASNKQEWAAHTIRKKINSQIDLYEESSDSSKINLKLKYKEHSSIREEQEKILDSFLEHERVNNYLSSVDYVGGEKVANAFLKRFIDERLEHYNDKRGNPTLNYVSELSPYIHFGCISPLYIQQQARTSPGTESFFEELIIRRELAINYVYYNPYYDKFDSLPNWSRLTLDEHKDDTREHLYSTTQLLEANTHDRFWNLSMKKMIETGYLHNTMRMYWGKKIMEWSVSPQEAYRKMLKLNNQYFLDGSDPNSYVGVGWCFGLHDRAFKEYPVIGKTRTMMASGLKRKYGDFHKI